MLERYIISHSKMNTIIRSGFQRTNLLLMGCIAALILLRDVGGADIGRFMFIGIATLICLLSDKTGIYCLLAFLTPLAPGISTTYITAISLVILLLKQKYKQVQIVGFSCMMVLLLIELASGFRGMFSLLDYLRFTGVLLVAFLRMLDLDDDYNNEAILQGYLFGFWTAMASILGQMLNKYSLNEFLHLNIRFGNTRHILNVTTEGMVVSYNPNGLGYLCLLAAFFCLLLYKKNKKVWYLLSFFVASLLGVMTQSRSFILTYLLGMFLYTLLSCHSIKSAIKSLFALVVGGGAVVGMAVRLLPEYVSSFIVRFQEADITNGRIDIANYYFNDMAEHIDRFVFGVGLQNYSGKYGYFISAHNSTQEVLIAWGLIGLLLVAILFLCIFWNGHVHNPKAKLVQYLPLVIYLVAIQSGQGFADTSGMLRIMVAYSAILLPIGDTSSKSRASGFKL